MKQKITSIILILLVIEIIAYRNLKVENEKNVDSNDVAYLESNYIDENSNSKYEVLEYVNNNGYSIDIEVDNVSIICTGSGSTKKDDEELVKNNFEIKASFSKEKNGKRFEKIEVENREKVFIHVVSTYDSKLLPSNEVKCNYSINVLEI